MAPLHVGALLFNYQAIDVFGPIDLLNSASKDIMEAFKHMAPIDEAVIAGAPQFVFHHIGITKDPVSLFSSHVTVVPTVTVDECPELDIILIGGPDPVGFNLHPKFADLIRRHVAAGKLLFTTCTGAAVAAMSGVLDGRNATMNHVFVEFGIQNFPKVKWTTDQKWVVDGNIWTGSGAVAGMDMVAHWLKENYGLSILSQSARGIDYEPRDIDGLLTVIPLRYDAQGKQISTHKFPRQQSSPEV